MSKTKQEEERTTSHLAISDITRRTALKMTAAAGAVTMLTSRKSWAFDLPPIPTEPTDCTPNPGKVRKRHRLCRRCRFLQIAIPTILNPQPTKSANTAAGEAARADHQDFNQFFPFVQYDISIQPTLHQFHPDIPPTYCWGYNGIYPGPTFLTCMALPSLVRFHNNLPVNHKGSGPTPTPRTCTMDIRLRKATVLPATSGGRDSSRTITTSTSTRASMRTRHWAIRWKRSTPTGITITGTALPRPTTIAVSTACTCFTISTITDWAFPTGDHDQDDNIGLPGPYGLYDIPLNLTDKLFCANGQMFATAPDAVARRRQVRRQWRDPAVLPGAQSASTASAFSTAARPGSGC